MCRTKLTQGGRTRLTVGALPHPRDPPRRAATCPGCPMADALPTPAEDLELLRSSAVTAGMIASGYFRKDVKNWTKGFDSPVSEADIVVDKYLRAALEKA